MIVFLENEKTVAWHSIRARVVGLSGCRVCFFENKNENTIDGTQYGHSFLQRTYKEEWPSKMYIRFLSEIEFYRLFRKFLSISTSSPGQHIFNFTGSLFYSNIIGSITLVIRQPSPALPGCGIRTRQPSQFWLPDLYQSYLFDNPTTRQSSSDWVSKMES